MTTKQISPARKAKAAAYKALPVALIQSPLKFMSGRLFDRGTATRAPRWEIQLAQMAADAGKGAEVQRMARQYL